MRVIFERGAFTALNVSEEDVNRLRDAKWKFSRDAWRTSQAGAVIPFIDACDESAAKRVGAIAAKRYAEIAPSIALDADIDIPAPPGCVYRPYQKAGIAYVLQRDKALIGDSMRLGKTIQAIGVANVSKVKRHLVICPATPKINWKREYTKWDTNGLTVGVADGACFPDTDVVIINYDIIARHESLIRQIVWDQITVDEAHYLKNESAKRTQAIFGDTSPRQKAKGSLEAKRWVFLTGTPVFTRPRDLWNICKFCDPHGLGKSRYKFMIRYCGGGYDPQGKWVEDGATNLEELQRLMRAKFMVRREKRDVSADIPPNCSTVILPKHGLEPLVEAERSFVQNSLNKLDDMIRLSVQMADLDRTENEPEEHPQPYDEEVIPLSSARRELALQKLPMILPQLHELAKDESKVVVFAHHRAVLTQLIKTLGDSAVLVWGGMSASKKQEAVDKFTNDDSVLFFLGNIQAAGQAINLAIADVVVFIELSWVPAEMDQAEERVWLPEKTDPIQIIRYVVEDSIDEVMVHVLDARQENIRKATHANRLGVKVVVN